MIPIVSKILSGNKVIATHYLGLAQRQLNILLKEMQLSIPKPLKTGKRKLNLGNGAYILVDVCYNARTMLIHIPLVTVEEELKEDELECSSNPIAVGAEYGDIGYALWERELYVCKDPPELFLEMNPYHLLCMRYRTELDVASLIVIDAKDDLTWQVIVERRSVFDDPLVLSFFYALDGLTVSAALSMDLLQLYVVTSRTSGAVRSGYYFHYSFDMETLGWTLTAQGNVPSPYSATSNRSHYVDRSGKVYGYWAVDYNTSVDSYAADGSCGFPVTVPGEKYDRYSYNFDGIYGGYWNINDSLYYQNNYRTDGVVILDGDMAQVIEQMTESSTQIYNEQYYWWDDDVPGGGYYGEWYRKQSGLRNDTYNFIASIGERKINTKTDGLTSSFYGESFATSEVIFGTPNMVYDTLDIIFDDFEYHDGITALEITSGGWVTKVKNGIIKTVDTSPESYANLRLLGAGGWGMPVCPAFYTILETRGIEEDDIDLNTIEYPIVLGEHFEIVKSFSSYDQISQDEYVGALVREVEGGDAVWHVYKNRIDFTEELEACIGRPIDQFSAIYWRSKKDCFNLME